MLLHGRKAPEIIFRALLQQSLTRLTKTKTLGDKSFGGTNRIALRKAVRIITPLGLAQTIAYGASYYLPAILAPAIARDLGVAPAASFAGLSAALILSSMMGPAVGRYVDRHGGRAPLALANVFFAGGLCLMASAQSLFMLACAWTCIGFGMGLGLYETAFAALAKIYGLGARNLIAGITLIAGFASTLSWPLTAWLETACGWRSACLVWALINILIALPLNLLLPRENTGISRQSAPPLSPAADATISPAKMRHERADMIALGGLFLMIGFSSSAIASTLPNLLTALGASPSAAIAAAALFGPAQVVARCLEMTVFSRMNPLASTLMATLTLPLGAVIIALGGSGFIALFVILYGCGNGVLTIARGALPLVIFGPQNYGHRIGLLVGPARLSSAVAPLLFGMMLQTSAPAALALVVGLHLLGFAALWSMYARAPDRWKESAISDFVIKPQGDDRADDSDHQTVDIEARDADSAKKTEDKAADKSADNAHDNVHQHALTRRIHNFTANEPGDKAEKNPT